MSSPRITATAADTWPPRQCISQRPAAGALGDGVNTPEAFYNQFIAPVLGKGPGVVYVLPDTEPFASFFIAASAYQ